MNILEYLDALLFGPTVDYKITSRYCLDDSVNRLRAIIIPRWNILARFQSGLCGFADPTKVRVSWHSPMYQPIFRPTFLGAFEYEKNVVILRGTIGVPLAQKIFTAIWVVAALAIPVVIWPSLRHNDVPFRLLPLVLPWVATVALIAVAAFARREVARIADALDAALA